MSSDLQIIEDFNWPEIKERIRALSENSAIYVGADAKKFGDRTRFITVIVLHFDQKNGSTYFFQTAKIHRPISVKEKLWKEVELAAMAASEIIEDVGDRPFRVHLDLNGSPMHKSHGIVRTAISYIESLGLVPVIKPDAFAATHVADHIVRGYHLR